MKRVGLLVLGGWLAACSGEDGANGQDGQDGVSILLNVSDEPAGMNCPNGGTRVESGRDDNSDGVLDAAEVDSTRFVCAGADGSSALVRLSDEAAGVNCAFGGTRVDAGVDNDGNGALDPAEITDTRYVCDDGPNEVDGLVFLSDPAIELMQELFFSTPDASLQRKLVGPRTADGDVLNLVVSPDGSKVLISGDIGSNLLNELFVLSLTDDSTAIEVSNLGTGGLLQSFAWSPDSQRVAYIASQDAPERNELYVVAADGTGNQSVSPTSDPLLDVQSFRWSPDGTRLAFIGDLDINDVLELYTVAPDGTDLQKVNPPLPVGRSVSSFEWSPDSSLLAYLAVQETDNVQELYVGEPDGANVRKVSGALVAGGNVQSFEWSPDGSQLAYRADRVVNGTFELFAVGVDQVGGAKLNPSPVTSGGVFTDYDWSPDGSRVAYRAIQETMGKTELFTVAPTGLGNTKISGALLDVSDVRSFQWSPDSTRIAFRADGEVDQVVELYVVDPDGADRVRLTTGIEFDEDGVIEFAWSPASSTLAFTVADVDVNSLYRVRGDGSALETIATAVEGAARIDFQWSSDGRSLAYRAALVTADESGLFVSPVDGAPVVQIADRSSAFSWRY